MVKNLLVIFTFINLFFITVANAVIPITSEEMSERLQLFNYPKRAPFLIKLKSEEKKTYTMTHYQSFVKNPLNPRESINVEFIEYRSKVAKSSAPLIFLLPPIGGITLVEKDMAPYLASKGFHALISVIPEEIVESRPTTDINGFLRRTTAVVRQELDWYEKYPWVDKSRIGIFGVSLGGIRSSLILGIEPRFKAGVLFVAGGDVPYILSHSIEKRIKKWRKARMKIEGFSSVDDFYNHLNNTLKLDPLYFTSLRDPSDLFMFIGKNDQIVPTKTQYQLWKSFGEPKHLDWSYGHYPTAATFRIYREDIINFYKSRL